MASPSVEDPEPWPAAGGGAVSLLLISKRLTDIERNM
jgi:hypothetical protein